MFKQDLINAVNALKTYGVDQEGKCRYAAGCVIGQLIPWLSYKLEADQHSYSASRVVNTVYPGSTMHALHVANLVQQCHDKAFADRLPIEDFKKEARSIINEFL